MSISKNYTQMLRANQPIEVACTGNPDETLISDVILNMNQFSLFKFRAVNKYFLNSLVNSELYFAPPEKLNDPFDCKVYIKKSLSNAINQSSGKDKDNLQKLNRMSGFFDEVEKDIRNFGVCAFSLELNNSLLWSHYADQHRGVCLMYNFPESFISYTSEQIIGISAVKYEVNPLTEWFISISASLNNFDFEKFAEELVKRVLVIKDKSWSYENEVRIIRKLSGNLPIKKTYLQQICFGMHTTESDINLIRKLIDGCDYRVNCCRIIRCKSDFGIKAVKI